MTQIASAKEGRITSELKQVALKENITEEELRNLVAEGKVVIPANTNHKNLSPIGIGRRLRTKVNANIGTSADFRKLEDELEKLRIVIKYQADTVMDLSTGGNITEIRRALLKNSPIPFGNVPIYQMMVENQSGKKPFVEMDPMKMLDYIEEQAEDGVDFMTIHAGLTLAALKRVQKDQRIAGIVSRGGASISAWMLHNNRENPLYEYYDKILAISRKYDVTLSLGDGLRPGSIADGTDRGQIAELIVLGELVDRARASGVQAMVEGPGHLPLNQVEMNIRLQKSICKEAPFYVLGPIVTDVAPGYDHITSAIGGAIAASAGADFLCYVTPSEHLGLPEVEQVKEGIIASRIAAHAGDISKNVPGSRERDALMSEARKKLDWGRQKEICLDPERFEQIRKDRDSDSTACSMCGEFCVYKVLKDL